MATWSTA
eukprot:SM013368S27069  [mRNA]  locus=s13368:87:110:+ [translate_table: standard]